MFVAEPGADAEDAGVLLSIVLDGERGNSFLLVLDARDLGELARVEVPHHIPFGFHGQFARALAACVAAGPATRARAARPRSGR